MIRDLRLAEHGLIIVERPLANFLPLSASGDYLKVGGGLAATQAEVAQLFARATPRRCPRTTRCSSASPTCCATLLLETPPNVGGGVRDAHARGVEDGGGAEARSPCAERRDVLDLFTKSAGEMLDRWFESAPIKAAFGFDAVVGNFASPYTPGSAYVLLHHVFGEVNGKRGQWGHALGGHGRDHAGDGEGVRARAAWRSAPVRRSRA